MILYIKIINLNYPQVLKVLSEEQEIIYLLYGSNTKSKIESSCPLRSFKT